MITANSHLDALRKMGVKGFDWMSYEQKDEFLSSAKWVAIADVDTLVYDDDFWIIPTVRNGSGRKVDGNEKYIFTWSETPFTEEFYEGLEWQENEIDIDDLLLDEE